MDGEREHAGVFETGSGGHRPLGVGEGDQTYDVSVFKLTDRGHLQLLGIVRGLDYLHRQRVVHGDLKGVRTVPAPHKAQRGTDRFSSSQYNILIDGLGIPCLADFGLSSIAGDIYSVSGSNAASGGSVRWSAPELLGSVTAAQQEWVNPTTQSDIYSLAMVIIEVIHQKFSTLHQAHVLSEGVHRGNPISDY